MLATLAAALFALTASASDTPATHVANHLDLEMALQSQGLVSETTGVVFAYGDGAQGDGDESTVGFAQLGTDSRPSSAIFRSAPESRLCTRVSVDASLASDASLAVYSARGEMLEDDETRIVFGRDAEGRTSMAVWVRPGETVTSVSAVDHRSGHRRARTELRQRNRTLTLSAEADEAPALWGGRGVEDNQAVACTSR